MTSNLHLIRAYKDKITSIAIFRCMLGHLKFSPIHTVPLKTFYNQVYLIKYQDVFKAFLYNSYLRFFIAGKHIGISGVNKGGYWGYLPPPLESWG